MIDLQFSHVSKKYRVGQERSAGGPQNALWRTIKSLRPGSREFWAVRDVSFEVPRGQALAIIGHNGAGKSTIMKMLANITAPTAGEIVINGRLAALIEVGSGLHPEFTGRENVYLSGSIRGMTRREIKEKFDSIIEFAGLRQFVDTPIKRYSSGMHVRLGFAIAAHLDSDILLLDEVLAVGDSNFRTKCYQRIDDLKLAGKTIVFISHDLKSVERLCDRALLMQRGELIADGAPPDVVKEYMKTAVKNPGGPATKNRAAAGPPPVSVTALDFYDEDGVETTTLRTGRPFTARLHYSAQAPLADVTASLFFSAEGHKAITFLSTLNQPEPINFEPGAGVVEFSCPALSLWPGIYHVGTMIKMRHAHFSESFDHTPSRVMISVEAEGRPSFGEFYMPHSVAQRAEPAASEEESDFIVSR